MHERDGVDGALRRAMRRRNIFQHSALPRSAASAASRRPTTYGAAEIHAETAAKLPEPPVPFKYSPETASRYTNGGGQMTINGVETAIFGVG